MKTEKESDSEGFIPKWVEDINTLLSLVGFVITLYVMIQVRQIRKSFLMKARLPEYVKDLRAAGSAFSASLGGWPGQRNQAHEQIKIAATLLKSAKAILPKDEKSHVTQILKKLNLASRDFHGHGYADANVVWDLYSDIQSAITSMNQVSKNMKWE